MRRVVLCLLVLLLCPWSAQGQPVSGAIKEVVIDYNTSGDKTLVAAVAGQTIRVYQWAVICNGANNLTLKDSTPATLHPVVNLPASGGWILDLHWEYPWFTAAVGKALVLNLSASQQCSGKVFYTQGSD